MKVVVYQPPSANASSEVIVYTDPQEPHRVGPGESVELEAEPPVKITAVCGFYRAEAIISQDSTVTIRWDRERQQMRLEI